MNTDSTHNPWTVIDEAIAYENNWIKLLHYNVINPSGNNSIYGKVHFKNIAIAIVPIDKEGNTYLVGQYRFTTNSYSWEIPEGGCPEGETSLAAAKRELLEETGLVASHWEEISTVYLSNSVSDELGYVFIATQLEQQLPQPEETEQLQVKKLPLKQVFKMVEDREITDALSVIALQKTELMLLKHQLKL